MENITDTLVSDTLVSFGSELKAIGRTADGALKFGAWLVLYGSPERTDASRLRDYFTKSTDFDFEEGDKTTVYYNHGLDPQLKRRKLGTATLHYKDAGIWMEGQLQARDEYEAKIQEMIKAGKLGASSGVPSHLVERKSVGDAHEILLWPLGKDASFTPTPAEPLTGCFSLKSLAAVEASQGFASPTSFIQTTHLQNLKDSLPDGLTFQDHSQHVLAANGEFYQRIASLAECRCVKSNRRWSAEKYGLLLDTATDLTRVAESIKALAHAHAPRPEPSPHATEILAQIELTRARLNGVEL